MKLLLDECVTRYLKPDLIGHDVFTAAEAGFKGLKNGELLRSAAGRFDVLITVDRNLQYQQNLSGLGIAILILACLSNSYKDLGTVVPSCLEALDSIQPGQVLTIHQT